MLEERTGLAHEYFEQLLDRVGLERPSAGEVVIEGQDPLLPSRYPIAERAAAVLAAHAVALNDLWALRTGRRQRARVEVRAAAASLRSSFHATLDGELLEREQTPDLLFSDLYRCKDGRWIQLHGGFPHLAAGTARLLECDYTHESIAAAVARWDSGELEEALAVARMCGAVARSGEEWAATEQGRALAALAPVDVIKLADSPPQPLPPGDRPLTGLRVLDLTRVLAGPVSGRTLAEHGADVLTIAAPHLPFVAPFIPVVNLGKRSAYLDLNAPAQAARLTELARETDVFIQGFRGGALERRGFGPEQLTQARPGLIYVSVNCYGPVGPWRNRPGWEQLGQAATGISVGQGGAEHPERLSSQACDYTTGYLAALGVLIALGRRAREGGSYHVRASLCQTGMWIEQAGRRFDPADACGIGEVDELRITTDGPMGSLRHLRPVLELSETPPHWSGPPVPLGAHPAEWP